MTSPLNEHAQGEKHRSFRQQTHRRLAIYSRNRVERVIVQYLKRARPGTNLRSHPENARVASVL